MSYRFTRLSVGGLLLGVVALAGSADAAVVTITGSLLHGDPTAEIDSQLLSIVPDDNRGSQDEMYVGDPSTIARPILRFDLGAIPSGQTIDSATLTLSIITSVPGGPTQIDAAGYRVLVSWTEDGVTWHSRDGSNPWNTAGADGAGTDRAASASFLLTNADNSGGTVTTDVTSDVSLWYTGGATNYGWLLAANPVVSGQYTDYRPREAGGSVNGPKLTVTYSEIPEPATLALSLAGVVCLCLRRRNSAGVAR